MRQLLTESILLSMLGSALGVLFAQWGTAALMQLAGSGVISRAEQQLTLDLTPNLRGFAFSGGLSLLIGILFGLAPAVCGAGRGTSFTPLSERRAGRFRLGKPLVTAQVALSLVLLIGAGLFVRTLHNLRAQDFGIDRERVLLARPRWRRPTAGNELEIVGMASDAIQTSPHDGDRWCSTRHIARRAAAWAPCA